MDDVRFPQYVESFIETTDKYLKFFNAKLERADEKPEARLYKIATGVDPVDLIVHRTERSFERSVGEYRARVSARLTAETVQFARGKEHLLNRCATLGALVTTENGGDVLCQCLIQADLQDTIAGILAAALIHARPSIIEPARRAFGHESPPPALSAWSDLDFEQLHYDYGHLGTGGAISSVHSRLRGRCRRVVEAAREGALRMWQRARNHSVRMAFLYTRP
jgi:hypothetical protein